MKELQIPQSLMDAYYVYKEFSEAHRSLYLSIDELQNINARKMKKPEAKRSIANVLEKINNYKNCVLRDNFDFTKRFADATAELSAELDKAFHGAIIMAVYDPYPIGNKDQYTAIYEFTASPIITETSLVRIPSKFVDFDGKKFSINPNYYFEIYLNTLTEAPYANVKFYVITKEELKDIMDKNIKAVITNFLGN